MLRLVLATAELKNAAVQEGGQFVQDQIESKIESGSETGSYYESSKIAYQVKDAFTTSSLGGNLIAILIGEVR